MPTAETSRVRLIAVCFALLVFSLFLTSYSARNSSISNMGSVLLGEIAHPIQRIARAASQSIENIWTGYIALQGLEEENQLLKLRLSSIETDNSRLREVEHEVERLRELVNAAQTMGISGIAAEVIGYDPSNWIQAITVNRGAADGVNLGMAVVKGNYLVGKVIGVGRRTSQILLLLDPTSGVDALVQSSRVRGVVEGNGRSGALLQYISPEENVKVGERIITSGMDGVFPKGLVIGLVSEVDKNAGRLFQRIKISPSVKFKRLESVLLVANYNSENSSLSN